MLGFDVLKNRYVLDCLLHAEGALHIGTGVASTTTDAPFIRAANVAFIPGSSLRGVLRSTVERLLQAIKPDGQFCGCFDEAKERPRNCDSSIEDAEELERKAKTDLRFCGMCRLFGSTAVASRLKISDAGQIGKPKEPVLRDGVGIDRDTETAREQIKYDFETLEAGCDFGFTIQVENVEEEEKALLYAMLVEFHQGVDLGGKRSRGLGRVTLMADYKVRYFDPDKQYALTKYLEEGKLRETTGSDFEADLRAAFRRYTESGEGDTHVAARVA